MSLHKKPHFDQIEDYLTTRGLRWCRECTFLRERRAPPAAVGPWCQSRARGRHPARPWLTPSLSVCVCANGRKFRIEGKDWSLSDRHATGVSSTCDRKTEQSSKHPTVLNIKPPQTTPRTSENRSVADQRHPRNLQCCPCSFHSRRHEEYRGAPRFPTLAFFQTQSDRDRRGPQIRRHTVTAAPLHKTGYASGKSREEKRKKKFTALHQQEKPIANISSSRAGTNLIPVFTKRSISARPTVPHGETRVRKQSETMVCSSGATSV